VCTTQLYFNKIRGQIEFNGIVQSIKQTHLKMMNNTILLYELYFFLLAIMVSVLI